MTPKRKISVDQIAVALSLLYVLLPLVMFAFGWLRIYYAIPIALVTGIFLYRLFRTLTVSESCFVTRETWKYWAFAALVVFVWVFFSGIGGFTYQNGDFSVRNPTYYDLCNLKWPVIYDLSTEPEDIQALIGSERVAFSYYMGFWLVPAFFSKLFSFSRRAQDWFLYLYAVLGILLVLYQITRIVKKISWKIPLVFVFFSGLDVVGKTIVARRLPSLIEHFEWWAGSELFQYASNTTLLYWVFNQAIPLWLIMSLFLQLDEKDIPALACFSFLYSPWATIGLVPLCLVSVFKEGKTSFKRALTWQNFVFPGIMLVTLGTWYWAVSSSAASAEGKNGFLFFLVPGGEVLETFLRYVLFILLEAGVFVLIMGKTGTRYPYFYATVIELIVFPLFHFIQYGFHSRGPIPVQFLLCVYCIRFLLTEDKTLAVRKKVLAVALCIGAVTAMDEIGRSIVKTYIEGETVFTPAGTSFANMQTEIEGLIYVINDEYFIYDYDQTFFFQYLAK